MAKVTITVHDDDGNEHHTEVEHNHDDILGTLYEAADNAAAWLNAASDGEHLDPDRWPTEAVVAIVAGINAAAEWASQLWDSADTSMAALGAVLGAVGA